MRIALTLLLSLLLTANASQAGDGVSEINAARALAGGVTPGDAPGYPVTISQSGNFQLTGNLIVADSNQTVISIDASDVEIDLRGFVVGCFKGSSPCTAGSGDGVSVGQIPSSENVRLLDGTVAGMGDNGVILGRGSSVVGLRVFDNGGDGIIMGADGRVALSLAVGNAENGVDIVSGGSISESIARGNGGNGFDVGDDGLVSRCSSQDNQGDGILGGARTTVSASFVDGNSGDGIRTGVSGTLRNNASRENQGDGIQAGPGSLAQANALHLNGGLQLNLGSESGYRENVISEASTSTVNAGPLNMGANLCEDSTVCP